MTNGKNLRKARKLSESINLVTAVRTDQPCWVLSGFALLVVNKHECKNSKKSVVFALSLPTDIPVWSVRFDRRTLIDILQNLAFRVRAHWGLCGYLVTIQREGGWGQIVFKKV